MSTEPIEERRLLDTHYPARGALDPWDSIPELPLNVRT